MARATTSSGCFIMCIRGLAQNTIKKRAIPSIVHKNNPCLKADLPLDTLSSPSASATSGVIAVLKPIPSDIAINIKLLPRDTAASSAVPN